MAGIHYMSRFGLLYNCSAVVEVHFYQIVKIGLTTFISIILNEHILELTGKAEKIGCIILIPSLYNIV